MSVGAMADADRGWQGRLAAHEARAEATYRRSVTACGERAADRAALIAEFAAVAEEMARLAGREELSPQHVATAHRLVARAERALRLLDGEQ